MVAMEVLLVVAREVLLVVDKGFDYGCGDDKLVVGA